MIDYPALAALAAVIREGTFERAADKLGITPSAVSQRIRGFEERVGTVLVVRGQPCTPTELGRTLCAHFDRVQLLEADLGLAMGAGPPPTLRLAVNADSLATWFPDAAAAYARQSEVCLELVLDDEAHTADRLRSGEVLAAVTSDPEPVHGCKTVRLGSLRYLACASPGYMEQHLAQGVDAEALARAPYLRFDRRDQLQARWAREVHGIELKGRAHWVPSAAGFLDCAVAGLAWGMQPRLLATPHLEAGRLAELTPGRAVEVELYWTVARIHATSLQALTRIVLEVARARLRSTPERAL